MSRYAQKAVFADPNDIPSLNLLAKGSQMTSLKINRELNKFTDDGEQWQTESHVIGR